MSVGIASSFRLALFTKNVSSSLPRAHLLVAELRETTFALIGEGGPSDASAFLLVSRALGTVQPGPADPHDRQRDEPGQAVDRVWRPEERLPILRASPASRGPDGGGPAAPDAETGAVAVAGPHRGALY